MITSPSPVTSPALCVCSSLTNWVLSKDYSTCLSNCAIGSYRCKGTLSTYYDSSKVVVCSSTDISTDPANNISSCELILELKKQLEGKILRLFYLFQGTNDSIQHIDSNGSITYSGYLPDTYRYIIHEANSNFTEIYSLSQATQDYLASIGSTSSFSGCIHDVILGNIDICVGGVSLSPTRATIVNFTIPSDTLGIYLLIRGDNSVITDMMAVFQPFNTQLWVLIVFMTAFTGIAFYFIGFANEDETEALTFFDSIYQAFKGFFEGGLNHEPLTYSGKILGIAFGMFTMIVISCYTANLASFLSDSSTNYTVNNLQDAMNLNYRICIPAYLVSIVQELYPNLTYQSQYLNYDTDTMMRSWFNGSAACDGYIVDDYIKILRRAKSLDQCSKLYFAPEMISKYYVAQAISEEIKDPINYHLIKYQNSGKFAKLVSSYNYSASEMCTVDTGSDGAFQPSNTLMLIIIFFFFYILSFLMYFYFKEPEIDENDPDIDDEIEDHQEDLNALNDIFDILEDYEFRADKVENEYVRKLLSSQMRDMKYMVEKNIIEIRTEIQAWNDTKEREEKEYLANNPEYEDDFD